jgi:hypothetical protein
MQIEFGDIDNPTGNAIIFWKLKGNNKLFKNAKIVASNFVISPLQFKNEILMVNFPPVLIEDFEKLLTIAEVNNIDLIKGEDIFVPDDIDDFQKFYKKQIEKYNGIIKRYLLAYKEKNSETVTMMSLPQLINEADSLMRGVRKLVKKEEKKELIKGKIEKLQEIQQHLNDEMKGFDLAGIIRIIDNPHNAIDQLVDLYKQKFLAIFLEDYEKAHLLKKEILSIEKELAS